MKPRVMIAVPTAEMARRADFYDYFNILVKPEDSLITLVHGQSPARGRNMAIKQALDHNCTHIFFIDDDLAFKPDLLLRLLAHDKDIVSGYYLMRNYPHQPILFDYADEDGKCRHMYPADDQSGLVEAVAYGLGCCLIKTDVLLAMKEECKDNTWVRLGELEPDHWCDDIGFFRRVRDYGFKLFCDLNAPCGHMAQVTIWPDRVNDAWYTTYDTNSQHGKVSFPALRPPVQDAVLEPV